MEERISKRLYNVIKVFIHCYLQKEITKVIIAHTLRRNQTDSQGSCVPF